MKRFTAPQMHSMEMYNRLSLGAVSHITEESNKRLYELINLLNDINPTKESDIWSFWVSVPRGEIEDFGDYEELREMGEYSSYEEFERSWREWFPKDTYWYEITIVSREGYVAITVNSSTVLNIDPHELSVGYENYEDFLQFLIDEVQAIIKGLTNGTYNQQIADSLPMEYRTGVISRFVLKYILPSVVEKTWQGLSFDEVVRFVKNSMDEQTIENREHPERLKTEEDRAHFEALREMLRTDECIERVHAMTANDYYNACAICYKAAEYKERENLAPKELYCYYADNRDGGLREINAESTVEFDEWFSGKAQPNCDLANASHKWEIVAGSTHTKIRLAVRKDERGFFMTLSGGLYTRTTDIVRMYNALKGNSYPVFLFNHKAIRNKLLFLDEVGIVPVTQTAHHFWYGGFPKDGIISYIELSELDLTDDERNRVVAAIEWFDIPKLSLKSKA